MEQKVIDVIEDLGDQIKRVALRLNHNTIEDWNAYMKLLANYLDLHNILHDINEIAKTEIEKRMGISQQL